MTSLTYVKVWVASSKYKSPAALTYQAAGPLPRGSLVRVPLKNDLVLGVVAAPVTSKPAFPTKPLQPLEDLPPLPAAWLTTARWLAEYYAAPLAAVLQMMLPAALSDRRLLAEPAATEPVLVRPEAGLPPLTAQQRQALAAISHPDTYLLHGQTGSGKTRIYLELIQRSLLAGRSAVILTPEIGLTSQLSHNLQAHLPGQVTILHSQLTAKQRQLAWLQLARGGRPQVVVGPRSALFSPLPDIGLIVIDEAHDSSYKQDQTPRYNALRAAAKLAGLHHSVLVLGSATPNVEDYYVAEQRHKPIIRLTELAKGEALAPEVHLVDLKDRSQFSGSHHLSRLLVKAIDEALGRGEQSLLYLNRRGTARLVLCEACGWQALCPRCDIPLIYHDDNHSLRCHTCGYQQALLVSCPQCSHPSILFKSAGTKAIAAEAERLFPGARVRRFDTDNHKPDRLETNYQAIRDGAADILVGTQTLAKGLDLPLLTTLGVVLADTSLSLPDFSAGERTYQQLSQVLGRIGRGHPTPAAGNGSWAGGGSLAAPQAYIQTYQPDSLILRAAISRDWTDFYQTELDGRRKFRFPPFCYLLKINCRRAVSKTAEKAIGAFAVSISRLPVIIEGPAPAFHERVAGKYSWQLTVKATRRSDLLKVVASLPTGNGWSFDLDPTDLL